MSEQNEYTDVRLQREDSAQQTNPQPVQQPYVQPQYPQQPYAQQGYPRYPQQPYGRNAAAPTLNKGGAKLPLAPLILTVVAALIDMYYVIIDISNGYADIAEYIISLLVFGAYALFIVDITRFKQNKHILAGIALMVFAAARLISIFAYDYFGNIGDLFDWGEYLIAIARCIYVISPVFLILGGLYYLLAKNGFKAMKLVAAILIMTASTLVDISAIIADCFSIFTVLSFAWGVCWGLAIILYSPVKKKRI